MEVIPKDLVQARLLLYGTWSTHVWEPSSSTLIRTVLTTRGGDCIIAGGHVGYFPLLAASVTCGRVLTCEPDSTNRWQLKRNADLNRCATVIVEDKALDEASGRSLSFVENTESSLRSGLSSASSTGSRVLTATIDDLCTKHELDSVSLVVLDIEGAEPEALRGAAALLAGSAERGPDWIVELVPGRREKQVHDQMIESFRTLGYSVFVIDDAYDYVLHEPRTDAQPVRLARVRSTADVERVAVAWNLKDPNLFATRRESMCGIVIVDEI
jgi:FkbM family methyltransferase